MTHCVQSPAAFRRRSRWQDKRLRVLKKMANMRAAKERKRLANPPPEPEPKLVPWFPLELGLRDKLTGEVAWVDFKSLRDATRRLAIVQKLYRPGLRSRP